MFRSNRSNRIETIIMIFRWPTTPQANCKNHVKVVMAFQGPVTDSKLKRSLDDRRSSTICTVLRMFMGWCGYNPRATFLFASNKFTGDPAIPLHFGCRHMWIFTNVILVFFLSPRLSALVSSSLEGYSDIGRFTGRQLLFPIIFPSIPASLSQLSN